jgi:hypothetical protein
MPRYRTGLEEQHLMPERRISPREAQLVAMQMDYTFSQDMTQPDVVTAEFRAALFGCTVRFERSLFFRWLQGFPVPSHIMSYHAETAARAAEVMDSLGFLNEYGTSRSPSYDVNLMVRITEPIDFIKIDLIIPDEKKLKPERPHFSPGRVLQVDG